MRHRTAVMTVIALFAITAAVPATATAATTIGPTMLTDMGLTNGSGCFGNCTFIPFQGALPGTPRSTSPIAGVIVRWRLGANAGDFKLRVLRPNGAGALSGAGTSATGASTGAVDTFKTRLRVKAGDALGLDNGSDALMFKSGVAGEYPDFFGPTGSFLPDGGPPSTPTHNTPTPNLQLQLNADVEPDADNDGFGDETQDGCPGDPARQAPPCATGPTNPGGTPSNAAPTVSAVTVKPRTFRLGTALPRFSKVATATTIAFKLSEAAATTVVFTQNRAGRLVGKRCKLQTARLHTGKRCKVLTRRGGLSTAGKKGANKLRFAGRLSAHRKLPPGSYVVAVKAKNSAGDVSKPATARFTLLKATK